MKQRLDDFQERLHVGVLGASQHLKGRLDVYQSALKGALPGLVTPQKQRVENLTDRLRADARRRLDQAKAQLSQAAASLEALSPVAILGRGYSITRLESTQEILQSADRAKPGDRIVTRLGKGRIVSKVEKTEPT
jgi:exodeoxyribonuclease VII large subunit